LFLKWLEIKLSDYNTYAIHLHVYLKTREQKSQLNVIHCIGMSHCFAVNSALVLRWYICDLQTMIAQIKNHFKKFTYILYKAL